MEAEQVWKDIVRDEHGEVGHSRDVEHGDTMYYFVGTFD